MRKFLKYNHCEDVLFDELNFSVEHFGPEFQKLNMMYDGKDRGTLNEMNKGINYDYVTMCSKNVRIDSFLWTIESFDDIKISTLKIFSLSDRDVEFLKKSMVLYIPMLNIETCIFVTHVGLPSM